MCRLGWEVAMGVEGDCIKGRNSAAVHACTVKELLTR